MADFSGLSLSQASTAASLQVTSPGLTGTTTNPVSVTAPAQARSTTRSPTVNQNANQLTSSSPSPPLVTMDRVALVTNSRHLVTEIVVSFSGGVNAVEAQELGIYRLVEVGKHGSD
jgi:hypothetical protein